MILPGRPEKHSYEPFGFERLILMEVFEKFEQKIHDLLRRLKELEAENRELRERLQQEQQDKEKVVQGLDKLLQKIQEIDIQ